MRMCIRFATTVATMLVVLTSVAFAQSAGGTVTGTVKFEASGAPVHGATIIVIGARP